MTSSDRGGTSRKAKIYNNIFYDCGESAITFPTADNESDGNLFVRMRGGYLRVMYPAPEVCLDLPSWQEFCGFDRAGQTGWFDISFSGETGEAAFAEAPSGPDSPAYQFPRAEPALSIGRVLPVPPDPLVREDCTGAPHPEGAVLPGPFNDPEHAVFPLPAACAFFSGGIDLE